jgi:hypothetical protein
VTITFPLFRKARRAPSPSPQAFVPLTGGSDFGALRVMSAEPPFVSLVVAILRRFAAENEIGAPDDAVLQGIAERLERRIRERGLPAPLCEPDRGRPGSLPEAELAPLVQSVVADVAEPVLIEAAKQLIKACFYPEFRDCRNSYRERSGDGACRRQELSRVRRRISGTHCVDCPLWIEHTPEAHAELLAAAWWTGSEAFRADASVYLPEDFRALRRWLQREARQT